MIFKSAFLLYHSLFAALDFRGFAMRASGLFAFVNTQEGELRMSPPMHVVCFGTDPMLLQTREAVLAREYRTTSVNTLAHLLRLSFECSYAAVVLCHTLTREEHEQAVILVRSCCPRAGIVALTRGDRSGNLRGSDRTVRGLDGPSALLEAVRLAVVERSWREMIPQPYRELPLSA